MRKLYFRCLRPAVRELAGLVLLCGAAAAPALAWEEVVEGDVFVGVNGGEVSTCKYLRYSASGTLLDILDTGVFNGGEGPPPTGCALNSRLDLFGTMFSNGLFRYSHDCGHCGGLYPFPTGASGAINNESLVFDSSGDLLVGFKDGRGLVERYDPLLGFVGAYSLVPGGTDWIDLAADQCTLFYTGEGRTIKRFDVCANTQLPDFATLPDTGNAAYALRLLPPGDGSGGLVVADTQDIKRLDGSGEVIATYGAPFENHWFAVNLTPDGQSLWSAAINTGNLYRFNLWTGLLEVGPISTGIPRGIEAVGGICVAGEPTAAVCSVVPERVRGLLAVRRDADVHLEWQSAGDAATDHYDPWKVVDGVKSLIPVANGITARTNPSLVAACPAVPRSTPSCTDAGAVAPPPLLFYQVRGACTDGVEGTEHPY